MKAKHRRIVLSGGRVDRRAFIRGAAMGTSGFGAALLFGCGGESTDPKALPAAGEEPPPEISTIKLKRSYSLCLAPLYLAKDFLLEEGFTDVQYLPIAKLSQINEAVATGFIDMSMNFAAPVVDAMDGGLGIKALGGVHAGCWEIFAREGIDTIGDLEGKTVGIQQAQPTDPDYLFVSTLLRFVGVPDVQLTAFSGNEMPTVLSVGKADAVVAFPPLSHQLRTLAVGHVILNSITDLPWANYVCCLLIARPEFIDKYPVATKRALRAIYRAADLCATDPQLAAQKLVDGAFAANLPYALETVSMGKYGVWRDYDPDDTMRFYALRLKETGVIDSDPETIIANYTDWRFLEALRKEMAFLPPPKDATAFAISCGPDGRPLFGPPLGS